MNSYNFYSIINHKREFAAKVRNKSFIVMTFKSVTFLELPQFVVFKSMKGTRSASLFMTNQGFLSKNLRRRTRAKGTTNTLIYPQLIKNSRIVSQKKVLRDYCISQRRVMQGTESKIHFFNSSPSISFIENVQDVIAKQYAP
jgi:ABC-2 type transport system permease protein